MLSTGSWKAAKLLPSSDSNVFALVVANGRAMDWILHEAARTGCRNCLIGMSGFVLQPVCRRPRSCSRHHASRSPESHEKTAKYPHKPAAVQAWIGAGSVNVGFRPTELFRIDRYARSRLVWMREAARAGIHWAGKTWMQSESFPRTFSSAGSAPSQTIDYSRVGIAPIRPPRRQAYRESDAAAIQGVIVIGNRHEKSASTAHANPAGPSSAFLRFSAGMPFAGVRRESIAELPGHFHGDNGRCAEVPGLRPGTLDNLRSEYNHCSGVVPLSAV
jgi:hypothetical protein